PSHTGSRAAGEVLVDPYYMAVNAVANYVALCRMRTPLRRLFDVNFGPDVPLPEITVEKIESSSVAVLAAAVANLANAGLAFTDRDTQNDLRDKLRLRHLPEVAAAIDGLPETVGVAPVRVPVEGGGLSMEEAARLAE